MYTEMISTIKLSARDVRSSYKLNRRERRKLRRKAASLSTMIS